MLESRGEFNYPALLMPLFCTILRRNYPPLVSMGRGLKSQGLLVFVSSSAPSFFHSAPPLPHSSLARARAPRFYAFHFTGDLIIPLSQSAPLNARPTRRRADAAVTDISHPRFGSAGRARWKTREPLPPRFLCPTAKLPNRPFESCVLGFRSPETSREAVDAGSAT